MAFKRININDYVRVKLTDTGYSIWEQSFSNLPLHLKKNMSQLKEREDKDGFVSFQLWHFIALFGNHTRLLMPPIITGDILIDEKYLIPHE